MTRHLKLTPVDVLHLRGNRLFGGPGDHAEAVMPPWPSVFAGAMRSRMLVDGGLDPHAFANGTSAMPGELARSLGTPTKPGDFRLSELALCSGTEIYVPAPADLVFTRPDPENPGAVTVFRLTPIPCNTLDGEIGRSWDLPWLPVLQTGNASKPAAGFWLRSAGLWAYLAGEEIKPDQVVHSSQLWETDPRLGIALEPETRTAEEGRIYTTDTVALADGVGFLAGIDGVPDPLLPEDGLVRLGGDGRGAWLAPWTGELGWPQPAGDGFTIILATPGLFPDGWRLPGLRHQNDDWLLELDGLTARLACAAVPRYQVISGWNLAIQKPKPAQRAVPRGAVYWFEPLRGSLEALETLQKEGLWPLIREQLGTPLDCGWQQRQAEGFNNIWLGRWSPTQNRV